MNKDQEKLILDHIHIPKYIYNAIKRWSTIRKFGASEAISCGNLSLVQAALAFDPKKSNSFYKYAYKWIRKSIIQKAFAENKLPHQLEKAIDVVADYTSEGLFGVVVDILQGKELECIKLRYIDGYEQKEIAEMWGVTRQAVKYHENKALAKLREAIAE